MALPKTKDTKHNQLSMLESMALDMLAEGKTARQIAQTLSITPGEASALAYDLLDREIITDVEQRRKLQVYRLEKLVEALWGRVMKSADRDDVRNLTDILEKLNILLGLNKEADAALESRMHMYQLERYMQVLMQMMMEFMQLAPNLMTKEQWEEWTADKLEGARTMMLEEKRD